MTHEQSIKWAAEIAALQQGKVIQYNSGFGWKDTPDPEFSSSNSYRVKPEYVVRPFRTEEVPLGVMVRREREGDYLCRGIISAISDGSFFALGIWYGFKDALCQLELLSPDGTWGPCGVKEDKP